MRAPSGMACWRRRARRAMSSTRYPRRVNEALKADDTLAQMRKQGMDTSGADPRPSPRLYRGRHQEVGRGHQRARPQEIITPDSSRLDYSRAAAGTFACRQVRLHASLRALPPAITRHRTARGSDHAQVADAQSLRLFIDREAARFQLAGRQAARVLRRAQCRAIRLSGRSRRRSDAARRARRRSATMPGAITACASGSGASSACSTSCSCPRRILLNSLVCETRSRHRRADQAVAATTCARTGAPTRKLSAGYGSMTKPGSSPRRPRPSPGISANARPAGWVLAPAESRVTCDLIKEAGYTHNLGWPVDDQPIWMRTRAGPILSVPYPMELNDIGTNVYRDHTGQRIRGHDRRAVRRAGRAIGGAAAGHVGVSPHLHHRPAVPAAAGAARP